MVESNALLKRRSPKGYRGFESLPLRQLANSLKTNQLTKREFRIYRHLTTKLTTFRFPNDNHFRVLR